MEGLIGRRAETEGKMRNAVTKVSLCGATFNKICYMESDLNFKRRKSSKKRGEGRISVRKDRSLWTFSSGARLL